MKEENKIDHLFKEGTQRHYPVDEGLWAQVEPQLPTKRSPSSFFSLNSLLFILVIFCCSLIPRDNSYSQQNSVLNNQSSAEEQSNINETPNHLTLVNQESIQPTPSENDPILQQINDIKSSSDQVIENITSPLLSSSATNRKEISNSIEKQPSNKSSLTEKTEVKDPLNLSKFVSTTAIESGFAVIDKQILHQKIPKIDLIDLEVFPLSGTYFPQYTSELKPPIHKSVFQFYEIDLFSNVFIQKNVRSNIMDLARYKEETEQPLSSYTAGMNTVRQKRHFIYGLGVQLNKYTEEVSYDIETESTSYFIKTDTSYRVINNQFSSNGIPVLLIEQVLIENRIPTTVILDDKLIVTNTIKRIRIPVFAGYNLNFKNWSTELRTSLIPSVLFQSQGVTIRQDQDRIESLDTETTERLTLSLNNQFRIGYAINESFVIGTSIYMENDLKSYSKEIDSKLNHQGLGIWVAIKP